MTSRDKKQTFSPGRILFPAGIGTACSAIGDTALYNILPTHTIEAGISFGNVGIILSINRIVRLLLNSVAGSAYDRSPRRKLFLFSLVISVVSTVLYAITSGFWSLFFGRVLWGIAWAGIWVGGTTIILDITNLKNRGRWMGFHQIWFYLGGVMGAVISGVVTDWLGYFPMMWIAVAIGCVGLIVSFLFLPETRHEQLEEVHKDDENGTANYLTNPIILIAALLQGINRFANAGVLTATLALLVKDHITVTGIAVGVATVTGLLSGIRLILSMIASPLIGIISDRAGNRWNSMLFMLIINSASMILIVKEHWLLFISGVFLAAITTGSLQTLAASVVGDAVTPAQRGKAISLLYTSGDLGSAIGPLAAYAVLPWIGLSGVFIFCAAVFLLGMPVTIWQSKLIVKKNKDKRDFLDKNP